MVSFKEYYEESAKFHGLAGRKINSMMAPDASKLMPAGSGNLSTDEEAEFATFLKDPTMAAAWKMAQRGVPKAMRG